MNKKQIKGKSLILGIHFVVLDWTVIMVNWGLAPMLDKNIINVACIWWRRIHYILKIKKEDKENETE